MKTVTTTTAISQLHPTRVRVVMAALVFIVASTVHAQASRDEAVIYGECLRPPQRTAWGRFAECGIDEDATRKLREEVDAGTRSLTRLEEHEIERRIDEQFAVPALARKQADLAILMDWIARSIEDAMENGTYQFSPADRKAILQAGTELQQVLIAASSGAVGRDELDGLTAEVRGIVVRVTGILAAAPRQIPPDTPQIESLVTRIDALVARVGTVIRDLDRERIAAPRVVRDGHAHALVLVRESKRICSTRRPAACSQLREVLDTIEAMREPLCRLPSELLSFCR
jgi:hypothetical protein